MQVKLLYIFIAISVSSAVLADQIQAQTWQSINGPVESEVRDIVIKNDSIYVASGDPGGLFKKRINSSQWFYSDISEGDGPFRKAISGLLSIAVDNEGNYYAGGAGDVTIGDGQAYNHFFISDNYGETWQEFRKGIEQCHTVNNVQVMPDNKLIITCIRVILLFNDETNSFEIISGFEWGDVHTLYPFDDKIYVGTQTGLWYTEDYGMNWIEIENDDLEIFALKHIENQFFIGTGNGLFRTDELTETWEEVNELSGQSVYAIQPFSNSIFVTTESGVYSVDLNNFSTEPVFPELAESEVHVINSTATSLLFGTETGLYNCISEQNSCALDGLPASWVRTINFQDGDVLWAGTTQKIHRYFTETSQWDSLSVPIGRARNIVPAGQDSIYVVDDTHFYRCSFSPFSCESNQIDPGTPLFDLKQNVTGDLFLASRKRVFQSSDKGENWEIIYTSTENNIFSLATFSDSLLFINEGGSVRYSLDTEAHEILNNSIDLITDEGVLYSSVNGIQRSTDFGESWSIVFPAGVGGIKFLLFDDDENKLYAISTLGRVYVTENYENGWGVNDEMYLINMESAAIGPDGTIYLGTMRGGIFINNQPLNPPITVSNKEEPGAGIPKSTILRQNYPNPFNPSTVISYELPVGSLVTVEVFDMLGRRVAVLVDGLQPAGVHTVSFDGSNLSSGTYIYRLQTEGFNEVKKMTLIK